jgi:hypothetical protein
VNNNVSTGYYQGCLARISGPTGKPDLVWATGTGEQCPGDGAETFGGTFSGSGRSFEFGVATKWTFDTAGTFYLVPGNGGVNPTPGPATPVPTGTPATGYCAIVNGITPVDLSDLPNIQIGPASCISFGPFAIGLSSLNWLPGLSGITDVSVPQVEVCFRELHLGSVSIFGMSFSLDILSAVISGILALRWLFRS